VIAVFFSQCFNWNIRGIPNPEQRGEANEQTSYRKNFFHGH